MNRIEYILNFDQQSTTINEVRTLLTAFAFCLKPQDAVELLLSSYKANLDIRNVALRKVTEDMERDFLPCHSELITGLIKEFDNLKAKERQSAGYCLSHFVEVSPIKIKQRIMKFFLTSRYIGIRRRGYKSLDCDNPSEFKLIENAWEMYHDPECCWLIVKHFPVSYLIENQAEIRASLCEPWQVSRFFIRVGPDYPELLNELRSLDSISYCYVLVKLTVPLAEEEAIAIFKENILDDRIGLLIWSFGRLGLWEALEFVKDELGGIEQERINALQSKYDF